MWVVTDDSSCNAIRKTTQYCRWIFPSYDSINNILFSLIYFKNTVYIYIYIYVYIYVYNTYKICVSWLFIFLVRLPVKSRLLVIKFWGSQKLCTGFGMVGTPKIHIVWGKTVFTSPIGRYPSSKVRSSSCPLMEQPWRDTPHPR